MGCKWCGSDNHQSEACPTRRLVKFLTSKEDVAPIGLPRVIVADEEHLVDTIEETHAVMHMKKLREK